MKPLLALLVLGGCLADVGEPATTADAPRESPSVPAEPPTRPATLREPLDRDTITASIAAIETEVDACTSRPHPSGPAEMRVRIDPAGGVRSVTTMYSPSIEVSNCVAQAIAETRFAPTRDGGAFSYVFMF